MLKGIVNITNLAAFRTGKSRKMTDESVTAGLKWPPDVAAQSEMANTTPMA